MFINNNKINENNKYILTHRRLFFNKIKKIITAVNNESINSLIATPTRGLSVRIGHENNISVMNDCSIVSVPYQIGDDEAGMIAVIGPTRMEYSRVIPLLEYIAKNMSKLFK